MATQHEIIGTYVESLKVMGLVEKIKRKIAE